MEEEAGTQKEISQAWKSATAKYLQRVKGSEEPAKWRKWEKADWSILII